MGGKSKPSDTQTVTQRTELPPWLEPALQTGLERVETQYGQGQPGQPGFSPVAPMSPQTLDALTSTELTARMGIPGMPQAFGQFAGTVGGAYGPGSPGFQSAMDAATRDITPRVQSAFQRAGRGSSGLAEVAMAEELADAFAGLYNQERQRQVGALSLAPQMEALAYQAPARLAQVGGALESQYGRELGEATDRYWHDALAPQTTLDQYLSRIQGIAPFGGQVQTEDRPLYQNRGAGALGGAMGGAGLAQSLGFGGPFGMGLGAIGGGLLGLFG